MNLLSKIQIPGLSLFRSYNRSFLSKDIVAGIVLTTLLVPQGMAYAELAGLPVITGLYTTIFCLIGYALMGPSRILVLGPDSSLGPIIAITLASILGVGATSAEYIGLASALALMVGLLMIIFGIARFGFVADLLSKPTQIGYMNGLALTILIGQLPKLFGFSTDADGLVNEVKAFFNGVTNGETLPAALIIGLVSLVIILVLTRVLPKIPAVLIAVLVAIVSTSFFDLAGKGVSLVGVLPQGFPPLTLPTLPSINQIVPLASAAIGITLVALTDTISTASAFAARSKQEVKGNGEMIGIGSANVAASFFQGFPVSTSGSRTAVADQAGAKSQLTGLVGAGLILGMIVLLPGLFKNLPQPTLAAVVIAASISLADFPGLARLWKQRRSEVLLSLIAFMGVAFLGVLQGIAVAVLVSIFVIFKRVWWPYHTILGKVKGISGYHDIRQYPHAKRLKGLEIFRFDGPIFFANSRAFKEQILHHTKVKPKPKWIIIASEPITDIDPTAADMLLELDAQLNEMNIFLVFAELKDPVRKKLERYELIGPLDPKHFFPTLDDAIKAYIKKTKTKWVESTSRVRKS